MNGVSQLTLIGQDFKMGDNWTNEAEDKDIYSQDTAPLVLKMMSSLFPYCISDFISDNVLSSSSSQ